LYFIFPSLNPTGSITMDGPVQIAWRTPQILHNIISMLHPLYRPDVLGVNKAAFEEGVKVHWGHRRYDGDQPLAMCKDEVRLDPRYEL
jgi:hypothetical protein